MRKANPSEKKPKPKKMDEEVKSETKKTGLFTEKPSQRLLNIKTVDAFADKKMLNSNSFAYVYSSGGIPCKIDHNSSTYKLKWNEDVIKEGFSLI